MILIKSMPDRDNNIVKHIEKYHFCTPKQVTQMYFGDLEYGRDIARRRLERLTELGYIQKFAEVNRIAEYAALKDDKGQDITHRCQPSRLIILDLYAKLISEGVEVETFKLEHFWCGGAYRSDAVLIFTFLDRRYSYIIECNISNHPANLEKYDKLNQLHKSEVLQFFNIDTFPRILFISDRANKGKLACSKIVQINTNLQPFGAIYLPN